MRFNSTSLTTEEAVRTGDKRFALLKRFADLLDKVKNAGVYDQNSLSLAAQLLQDIVAFFAIEGPVHDSVSQHDFLHPEVAIEHLKQLEHTVLLRAGLHITLGDPGHINFPKIKKYFELYENATTEEKSLAYIKWIQNRKGSDGAFGDPNGLLFTDRYLRYLFFAEITPEIFFATLPVIGKLLADVFGGEDYVDSHKYILTKDFNRRLVLAMIDYNTNNNLTWWEKQIVINQNTVLSLVKKQDFIGLQRYFNSAAQKNIAPHYVSDVLVLLDFIVLQTSKTLQEHVFLKVFREDLSHCLSVAPKVTLFNQSKQVAHTTGDASARIIQIFWRLYVAKRAFEKNIYGNYSSLISTQESTAALSLLMFGQRVAAFFDEEIKNPYTENALVYHRTSAKRTDSKLVSDYFRILHVTTLPLYYRKEYHPMVHFAQSDLGVRTLSSGDHIEVMHSGNRNKTSQEHYLISCGMGPSLWHMAKTIFFNANESRKIVARKQVVIETALARLWNTETALPRSLSALIDFLAPLLAKISLRPDYPTHFLSTCITHFLNHSPALSEEAIKRIALIGAITLRFYAKDYDKFSFFIYVIVHEMSLVLSSESDETKHNRFLKFQEEALATACYAFDLSAEQIEESHHFLALPANSGMHSYLLAIQLARVNKNEKINIVGKHYFENGLLHHDFLERKNKVNAAIISFCAGPIVHGNHAYRDYPGLDINEVVQTEIVEKNITEHRTLIVDATSALYAKLALNADTKRLIAEGKLSIIIFESHQKFGLLHTDQAQYGRVFAILSKSFYSADYVNHKRQLAEFDFKTHLDMRIGAFMNDVIPVHLMEKIKKQHFKNGEIFYRIDLTNCQQSQEQAKKLLFCTSSNPHYRAAAYQVMQHRDSFGHYESTLSIINSDYYRVSPGGSDHIDTLVQWMQVLLLMHNEPSDIQQLLVGEIYQVGQFSLDDQILKMAVLSVFIFQLNFPKKDQPPKETAVVLHSIKKLLAQCDALRGRPSYRKAASFCYELSSHVDARFFMQYGKFYNERMFAQAVEEDFKKCLENKILPRYRQLSVTLTRLIEEHKWSSDERKKLWAYYHFLSNIDISLIDREIQTIFIKYDFMTKKGEWTARFHQFQPQIAPLVCINSTS